MFNLVICQNNYAIYNKIYLQMLFFTYILYFNDDFHKLHLKYHFIMYY